MKTLTITPQGGRTVVAVSLGWADQSGGVRILASDIVGSDIYPLLIDPLSPFIGNITTPFTIVPALQLPGLAANDTQTRHRADILIWYDNLPPCFPRRGVYYDSYISPKGSLVGNLLTSEIRWTLGRRRTTINMYGYGPTITSGVVRIVSVAAGFLTTAEVYRATIPPNQGAILEFNEGGMTATNASGATYSYLTTSSIPSQIAGIVVTDTDPTTDLLVGFETRDY